MLLHLDYFEVTLRYVSVIYSTWEIFGKVKGVWSDPTFSSDQIITDGTTAPEERGDYIIRWKVKDAYGAESDWGTLEVTVPKSKPYYYTPVQRFL